MALTVRQFPMAAKSNFLTDRLGPPDGKHIEPVAGDVVAIDAIVNGSLQNMLQLNIGGVGGAPAQPYHLFAGIRGGREISQGAGLQRTFCTAGLAAELAVLSSARVPGPGHLELVSGAGNPATPVDSNGFGQANDFYQRQMGQMTVISPQQDLLAEVTPQLKVTSADDAQVFLHVGDLSNSKLAGMANQFGYSRALRSRLGNMHYLQSLTTQLGVPPQQAMEVAERLADARLVSPLGGSYELLTRANQPPIWFATGLRNEAAGGTTAGATAGMLPTPPSGFQTPPLDWFRGLDLRFKSDPGRLMAVDATVLMLRPVLTPPPPSPAASGNTTGTAARAGENRARPILPPTHRPAAQAAQACEVESLDC